MKTSNQIISVFLLTFIALSAIADEIVILNTRSDVEQKVLLLKPDSPKASIILFAGGKGVLGLSTVFRYPYIKWGKKNFLVRTKNLFLNNGFLVAVVDAPSDMQSKKGMLGGFRDSSEHVEDIDQVIQYLRQQESIPVWLVGTSRGTESVANIAINSQQVPDGIVLTSSISVNNTKGTAVTEMDLSKITVPALIVANVSDECVITPAEGADRIAALLVNAKKVEVKKFSGGSTPHSKPCKAMSHHGFLGIDGVVVNSISDYIESN